MPVVTAMDVNPDRSRARLGQALDAGADVAGAEKAAYDLLSRLRTVAQRAPGTLDSVATAEALLRSARAVATYTDGAVLVRSDGRQLTALAHLGNGQPDWDLTLSQDGPVEEAWSTQLAQLREHGLLREGGGSPQGSCLVIPLTLGLRTLGLLVLESDQSRAWSSSDCNLVQARAEEITLSLGTGLLFDEVRELATAEERNRLAREIHDGIAQDLVFLGYTLDNLITEAGAPDPGLLPQLQDMRQKVTLLVGALRSSLFDLRSNRDPSAGLGTALSEHVQGVGATQPALTVHLSLREAPVRLRPVAELELLRIAQEAVTNVRKHAQARNLWVTCVVEPPYAHIIIEDDGVGMSSEGHPARHGLSIMRERAARLDAQLTVRPGSSGGTRVEVRLNHLDPRPVAD